MMAEKVFDMSGRRKVEIGSAVVIQDARSAEAEVLPMGGDWFQTLFHHSMDAVIIADDEGRFVEVNSICCSLFGYTREQLLRMRISDLASPERPGAAERYAQYLQRGKESGEFTFIRPDNEVRTTFYSACRLAPGMHLSILRDITAQKRGETARSTLKAVMDNIPTGVTIADGPDVVIRSVSKHGQELTGRERTELEGIPAEEHVATWGILRADGTSPMPEELPLTRATRQGEEVHDEEWVIQRPDGQKITVLCNAGPIQDVEGNTIGGVIAWRDITARKQMELALRQVNRRLTDVLEGITDAFVSIDREWRFTYINAAAEKILGRERQELLGQDLRLAYSDKASRRLFSLFAEAAAAQIPLNLEEYSEELDAWLEIRVYPSSEGPSFFFRDITDRKRLDQEKARLFSESVHSKQRLDDLIASVPGVVWEAWGQPDAASQRIDYVSEFVEKMLGYTVHEWLTTPNFWLTIVHPDDREKAAQTSMEAWASGSEHINEFRWVAKDGRVIPVISHAMVIQDADGRSIGMRGVTLDVTARHQAAEALRVSEARLSGIISSATDAILTLDDRQRIVVFNHAAEEMFGCAASEVLGGSIDRFVPERFRMTHRQHIRDFGLTGVTNRSMTSRQALLACRVNGEEFPIEATISQVEAGGQRLYTVIVRDITRRQEAEAQINALNTRLHRAVYESSHRIKNQLQILAATVDIILMNGENLIAADEFRRIGTQIRTLSVIQDLLTLEWRADATGTVETVSSKMMLERVLDVLRQTTSGERVVFQVADTPLPVRMATTLALIGNELAANAIKHGRQSVEVLFEVNEGRGVLVVSDDGPGFPVGFDSQTAANTGLELVSSLAKYDLDGVAEYANRPQGGARVVITFPLATAFDEAAGKA